MKIAVILISLGQALLAVAAIVAVGADVEALPAIVSLIGALASCAVAINDFQRFPASVAAGCNAFAVACYFLMAVLLGGDNGVGFALVVETGLIFLIAGPPLVNGALLLIASIPKPVNPPAEIQDGPSISN